MATRAKSSAPKNMAARKPSPKRKPARKAPRWDDPPRRGNPLGLVLIAAAAIGMVYTACAPKAKHAGGPPPTPVAQAPAPETVVPRGRYRPARPVQGAQEPKRVEAVETPRVVEREKAVAAPAATKPGSDRLAADEAPTDVVVAPESGEGLDSSEVPGPPASPARPAPPAPAAKPAQPAITAPKPTARRIVRGEFSHNPRATGEVALTFDGCYDDAPLPKILAALDQRGYRATFFIAGVFADRYPSSVKRIADAGMEIGNHSWSHPAFTKLSESGIDRQLDRTNDRIRKIIGVSPSLFRPPFGARDDRVRRLVAEDGFETVYWALDSWDAVRKGITAQQVSQRVLSRVQPGDVVLMHIGSKATADALPAIFKGLDERGLRVVTVSELMSR